MLYDETIFKKLKKQSLKQCFFCHPDENRIIYESDNFNVIAGLGQIQPGYTMIAPKEHITSFADLNKKLWSEFNSIEQHLTKKLKQFAPFLIKYEHGKIGGCLFNEQNDSKHCYHAHRVFVPWSNTFKPKLPLNIKPLLLKNPEQLLEIEEHYLYINNYVYQIKPSLQLESQFIRKYLCDIIDSLDKWCWAKYPDFDSAFHTTKILQEIW